MASSRLAEQGKLRREACGIAFGSSAMRPATLIAPSSATAIGCRQPRAVGNGEAGIRRSQRAGHFVTNDRSNVWQVAGSRTAPITSMPSDQHHALPGAKPTAPASDGFVDNAHQLEVLGSSPAGWR